MKIMLEITNLTVVGKVKFIKPSEWRKDNSSINLKKSNHWRWFGFILAVIGAYILGNAQVQSQWIGWTICSISCLIWIFMGVKDRDIPRTLMEIMYLIIGIRSDYQLDKALLNLININYFHF